MGLRAGDLELLEALLAEGSASGAARRLRVEQSTVSRRLATLEERLGRPLFVRGSSGLVATPLAHRLGASAKDLVGALRTADRALADEAGAPAGLVRLALPEAFAEFVVAPRLPSLAARHPALRVSIDDGPDVVDLARVDAHLAVRAARPVAGDVVAKLVLEDRLGFFGRAEAAGVRPYREDDVLGWDAAYAHLPEARLLAGVAPGSRFTFCRMSTMVAAARAGTGLLLTTPTFARVLGLVEAEGAPSVAARAQLWMAAPVGLRESPAVAAVWTWLEEIFAAAPGPD